MRVKGPFAPIRTGLIEHMWAITPMECKVYLTQHLMAIRTGKDSGKVFTSIRQLAKLTNHKWDHVKKSLLGLEEKDYIRKIDGGWQILNFDGDNPANTLSQNGVYPKTGYTPKRDKDYPKKGERPIPKRDTPLSQNGITGSGKVKKTKIDTPPLDDKKTYKRDDQEAESAKPDSFPENWPQWYRGIGWDKKGQKVTFTEETREALSNHLQQIAAEEKLRPLTRIEAQRSWGRLNGYLIKPQNSRCRGLKSLAAIVVNWFENDLRDANRIRGPTSKQNAADVAFDEAIRKAEEEERER